MFGNRWFSQTWHPDQNLDWSLGYDLRHWMIGFSWFWGGFHVQLGPVFIDYSNVPF